MEEPVSRLHSRYRLWLTPILETTGSIVMVPTLQVVVVVTAVRCWLSAVRHSAVRHNNSLGRALYFFL